MSRTCSNCERKRKRCSQDCVEASGACAASSATTDCGRAFASSFASSFGSGSGEGSGLAPCVPRGHLHVALHESVAGLARQFWSHLVRVRVRVIVRVRVRARVRARD